MTIGVIIGLYDNTQDTQTDIPTQEVNDLSTLNAPEATSDGTNPSSHGGINGTNLPSHGVISYTNPHSRGDINNADPTIFGDIKGTSVPISGGNKSTDLPNLGTTDGTNQPRLGTTDHTDLPSFGTIDRTDTPSLRTTDGSNPSSLGTTDGPNAPSLVTTDGTNPPSLWTTDRTGTPSFGTTDDSNPPSLGTTDGTNPISLGRSTDGTNPPSLGSTDGTNPPSLGTTDGTNSPSLETTESTNPPILWTTKTARKCLGETILLTCKENKVIAVDDAFYGRKIQERHCGCYGSLLSSSSCSRCKFVDDSPGHNLPYVLFVRTYIWEATSSTVFLKTWGRISVYARHSLVTRTVAQGVRVWSGRERLHASFVAQVDSVRRRYSPRTDALPVKKHLEATYHCEAPAQDGVVTFGGKENGPGQFHALKGLAVSSTDEIFVPDWYNRRIQVFSMKGDHLRSLKTGLFNQHAITTGRDDTLPGTEAGDLSNPYGITVDSLGRVLVVDQFNSRVEMFTAEGGHIGRPVSVVVVTRCGALTRGARGTSKGKGEKRSNR
ncbi:hypothetical protein Bbelb_374120 [Branchiostoma belcheri]|nr:hypothetical protein Bbelb_374120 [Branchiostoma belcheri]